ncbi:hypothetical protein HGRIS_013030 [Hohenbuehelia grisea]|uniref:Protein kinase domain-containing protein n=1 Tax=Hohenbuehelia grisea TaxID=104357 RepID=A0ABR3IUB7_9AGAR
MLTGWESDLETLASSSPSSTQSSIDEDEVNRRVAPCWSRFRHLFEARGFHLETCRDVQHYYGPTKCQHPSYYQSYGVDKLDEDALCPDPGLRENLFRGIRTSDGLKIMVKAVHLDSREFNVIRLLSTPPLRDDPMNHCIPVLALLAVPEEALGFIVMEEWSSQLVSVTPCSFRLFLAALRQCIEHAVFMHRHQIAHLDISLRNLLTDYKGHYAYIDFELSRCFNGTPCPRVHGLRGTEIPPEAERGELYDPYKADVWAMAILILRACKLTGYSQLEVMEFVRPLLVDNPHQRPTMQAALYAFDRMAASIDQEQLELTCPAQS